MRLIHTSDWHFGKKFLGVDMLPLQETFCDWFVDLVAQEHIDCVLVSGDLFERPNPRDEVIDLLDDVLHRISATGASIVLISGNHDSAERLHFGTRFMSGGGLYIRTERREPTDIAAPVTVTGRDGVEVDVLPLPYLDPERVALAAGTVRNHESVLRAVLEHRRAAVRNPQHTIAMAHAFVTGGTSTDSEKNLMMGGTGAVPADLFDDFGYVALGHLHRPQELGDGRLIYSGTPMPYSFSEEHDKSIRVVDFDGHRFESATIASTACRPVVTIEGPLDEVASSAKFERHRTSFVRVRLTDPDFRIGAMDRLRERFPHVLDVEQTSITQQGQIDAERLKILARRSESEVVREYVAETWSDGLDEFGTRFVDEALASAVKEVGS